MPDAALRNRTIAEPVEFTAEPIGVTRPRGAHRAAEADPMVTTRAHAGGESGT